METMDRDQRFLLNVTKSSKFIQPRKDNASKSKMSTKELTFHFINQLPEDVFNNLLEIYRIDFEIFGYEIPKFVQEYHEVEISNFGHQTLKVSSFFQVK
jgi:hypothetical protein